jgi:hypothetical protein
MKLTADLSHFLVGREFAYPVKEDEHAKIRRILEAGWVSRHRDGCLLDLDGGGGRLELLSV